MSNQSHDLPVNVLLIDDNEDDYIFIRELLAGIYSPSYQLDWVTTIDAGVAAITAQRYDVYLLNYCLCSENSLEVLYGISKLSANAPIIFLNGTTDRTIDFNTMELGAIDFLYKDEITVSSLERSLCYAIRQQKIKAALHAQAERERLIREITQQIRQSLNLDTILNTTVSEVRKFLATDRVIIYRFYSNLAGQVIVESVSSPCFSILGYTIHDPCFRKSWQEPYKQGKASAIEDIATSSLHPCYVRLLNQYQIRATLVLPILQGDTLWGLLIAHQCTSSRYWHQTEIDLLEQIASQVAIAIQQSELYRQVQNLNTNLEQKVQSRTAQLQEAFEFEATLKRITDKVRDSFDEQHILQTAVEELVNALDADLCDAALYDLGKNTVTICYESLRINLIPAVGLVISLERLPEVHHQILNGQYVQFCLRASPPTTRRIEQSHAILACPLMDDQSIFGNLWVFHAPRHQYSDSEIRLAQQVANQCAIALRQARLYKAVQNQVEELERLNRLKDDFLNTVSHELRTPMSNINMALQMLEIILERANLTQSDREEAIRYFQVLHDESHREISLINDLLDLARLDAHTEPLSLTVVDLRTWIPHIAEPFTIRSQVHQQSIELNIPPDLPLITTNLEGLERILTELLNNACKYTPPQQKIRVAVQPLPNHLRICISNTGIEIPDRERNHIFDKFYRIPSNDPWKYSGTGLGLALVKKRVEHLGGTIWVESADNQTAFVVELPMHLEISQETD